MRYEKTISHGDDPMTHKPFVQMICPVEITIIQLDGPNDKDVSFMIETDRGEFDTVVPFGSYQRIMQKQKSNTKIFSKHISHDMLYDFELRTNPGFTYKVIFEEKKYPSNKPASKSKSTPTPQKTLFE